MAKPKGQPKTGGRRKGTQNKATAAARAAIAQFVDKNANRLQQWLDHVSKGRKGKVRTKNGVEEVWIVMPDPEKAFTLFQSVVEYHVPKLARTELMGADGEPQSGPVTIVVNPVQPSERQR